MMGLVFGLVRYGRFCQRMALSLSLHIYKDNLLSARRFMSKLTLQIVKIKFFPISNKSDYIINLG